jgi:hypothetical protein
MRELRVLDENNKIIEPINEFCYWQKEKSKTFDFSFSFLHTIIIVNNSKIRRMEYE